VSREAGKDDIKRAYRKLAIQYHPDRNPDNPNAEERFKEATEAYEILADENKRQAYDQFGFAGVEGLGGGARDYSSIFRDFEDIFGDFSGIFDSFFGGGRRRRPGSNVRRGADLRYDLEVPFESAAFGTRMEIAYQRHETCQRCKGAGGEDGTGRRLCPSCAGSGQVRRSSGFFSIATPCPACNGEGEILENPCRDCAGAGVVKNHRRIKVKIPAGIETGKRITIPDQGDAGPNGGASGNLYVYIHVAPHERFERSGNDLYCMVPVSVSQAALGADINVKTLQGEAVRIKVPAGTQNGRIVRVRGEGVPLLNSPNRRGDLYVKLRVDIPLKLSSRARDLFKELASLNGENDSPDPIPLSEIGNS
jgi:molecular chaperone DnaJ